ncbi:CBS domain-containing protein [Nocardia sp. NPDC049149]|uniref:CBS domain-containing protein n=1 Tax=Nocardia sp. NPDC049149 TaxID=3364315 RepID=UPI00371462AA
MTRDVVSVRASSSFQQVVRTFAEQDISAAPVLGPRSKVIGIVSEGDLLRRTSESSTHSPNTDTHQDTAIAQCGRLSAAQSWP